MHIFYPAYTAAVLQLQIAQRNAHPNDSGTRFPPPGFHAVDNKAHDDIGCLIKNAGDQHVKPTVATEVLA